MKNKEIKLVIISFLLLFVVFIFGCAKSGDTYVIENTQYVPEPEVPVEEPGETPEDPVDEEPDSCQREPNQDHICKTKLVGFKEGLTENDEAALKTAKQRCKVYYPDAPCLKKFIKKGNQTYHAICGKNHEKLR